MEYRTYTIIDSNGQKYIAGWDEHGWFSIEKVLLLNPEEYGTAEGPRVEYEGEEYIAWNDSDEIEVSFDAPGCETLIEAIEEGL